MKQSVSRVRARKTRHRERQANRVWAAPVPFRDGPLMGFLVVLLLWGAGVILLSLEPLWQRRFSPQVLIPLSGYSTLLLVGLLTGGLYIKVVRPSVLRSNSTLALLAVIILVSLLPAKALVYVGTDYAMRPEIVAFLLPLVMAPLLTTILVDSVLGVPVGVFTSLVMAAMMPRGLSFTMLATGIAITLITTEAARGVRTRSKVARTGVVLGLCQITGVFGWNAVNWQTTDTMLILHQAGACLISGFLSAILVLLILPIFEVLFKITTNITLLELSDLGHPLLQRLALEAPGTYHHSLVVANLAQAAADEIGANSLLTRVCSYFHDIGKLTKPDFFSENIHLKKNPHDDLPPSMSTLVITAHVKEGLSLAMLHKLPAPVLDVIREHHGTSVLSWFRHKARTQLELELGKAAGTGVRPNGSTVLHDEDFRYPGPKPSSRESAIICLADAVEAASRSMEKTSPAHIENLVTDIIHARIADGQLDDCELKLAELTRIRRSFIFTLTNMLHGRVPYPKDEDRNKQQTRPAQAEPDEDKTFDSVPDGAGR